MSSTAIVSKMLVSRSELNTPQGQATMGVLLFQDLAFVPLLIVIPELAKGGDSLGTALGFAAIKAAVALSALLIFGQAVMRRWFHLVARARSPELFMLNLLLVTLGLALVTELAGLSLALGAFLAGMLIAETQYRYQVEEDIRPFRDVLLGLFFVTVGMQLDFSVVVNNFQWVLLALVIPIVGKLVLITVLARLFGNSLASSIKTGFYLAQAGEFAFVLFTATEGNALLPRDIQQVLLAAMLLSMLIAPLLIQATEPISKKLTANDWLARAAQLTMVACADDGAAGPRADLRLRPQRTESRADPRRGTDRLQSHWTMTRSACARRRAPADRWSTAMRRAGKRCSPPGFPAGARAGDHVRRYADGNEDSAYRA
jgi:CPA2 family monovalent cation:H+ antiporter-2